MREDYSESLIVHFRRVEGLRREALSCHAIDLNVRQLCDLELLLNRGYYPLTGYMDKNAYESVLTDMRLEDTTVWPMPICLDVDRKTALQLKPGDRVALNDGEGFLLAILTVSDVWQPDKEREALAVFGTRDSSAHPGVMQLYDRTGEYYVAGELEGVSLPIHYDFQPLRLTPSETVRRFTMNGWRRILGFHTSEYLHCAHREMVLAAAREAGAAVFLQPVAELSHPGNLDYYTQIRCYQAFTEKFPANMILLGITPFAGRKAGPREALWQEIIRRNFGCSHFMVAPDHADPFAGKDDDSRFYPLGAAQKMVAEYAEETGIHMVPLEEMGYHQEMKKYVFLKDVSEDEVATISSRELHRKLVQ